MIPTYLIGGGWVPDGFEQTYGPFIRAATKAARKILLILAAEDEADKPELAAKYEAVFSRLGVGTEELCLRWISAKTPFEPQTLIALQPTGVFVGGGLTPLYRNALGGDVTWLEYLQQRQVPYAGFSAGAAIAAENAIVGGWKVQRGEREVAVLDADFSEGLERVTVRPGLGLVPFAVDVHASQWGTVTRLMHAVELGLVEAGWAIDENTMLQVEGGQVRVLGLGQAYWVERGAAGQVLVRLQVAGEAL